jgi:2-dehydro-3-deoxyphosphogluconate aldolase / (4S)-4-hydroxy-2-oxoglutarate aldolase
MTGALDRIAALRLLPVLTVDDADEAASACRALLAGGISVVEVTFRTAAAAAAIRAAARIEGLVVGAGTVRSPEQLRLAIDAGARFGVAPGLDPDVVEAAQLHGFDFLPGVATASEVGRALALGCGAVKVFPASLLGGPAFVQALAPVFPEARFLPTGGVNLDNLASYLALPAVLACGGTWICERSLLRDGRWDEVERRAREAVERAGPVAV